MRRISFEPYRVKVVEPIPVLSDEERLEALVRADWNPFKLRADEVTIDLLTDSGFSAMSAEQWAALSRGDESYAGSKSYERLERVVRELTGVEHVLPAHQGRGAEAVLFAALDVTGKLVVSNALFDTTRAHVTVAGGVGLDLPSPASRDLGKPAPWKGDIDLELLEKTLVDAAAGKTQPVAAIVLTITNNTCGAQPVSLANVRGVRALSSRFKVPFFLDACRFAENAWFVKLRDPSQAHRSAREIARECFELADGFTFSAKKDAFASIGGLLGIKDAALAERARAVTVLREGFPTYGGLAGRDLEAIATGLEEATDETWLSYRIEQMTRFGRALAEAGAPIVEPPGGHAIYVDAARLLPHVPKAQFPGHALACELYLRGGVRSCEVGSLMMGAAARQELLRLAVPRRIYTESHLEHVVETMRAVVLDAKSIRGLEIVQAPAVLRHFTASLRPVALGETARAVATSTSSSS